MDKTNVSIVKQYSKRNHKKIYIILGLVLLTLLLFALCIFIGASKMSFLDCINAILQKSSNANNRIMWKVRIPRAIAALVCGAGLSIAGLIMQTTLGNSMASPSTLGVSNAAVFGANLSIIAFAGGFLSVGHNINNYFSSANPYQTSLFAFIFSLLSILVILGLCKIQSFNPNAVVLAGIAIGAIWSALTTLLQYFATDVGLSSAVIWSFGDLGRATYKLDLIMSVVVVLGVIFFSILSWRYNALLSGDNVAKSIGINVDLLRFISLLVASLITAVCVSFIGVIGFIGIICPHAMKRILGNDHRYLIPASTLAGSVLLLASDALSILVGNGTSLPVGAVTAIFGAPFFLYLIFAKKENSKC